MADFKPVQPGEQVVLGAAEWNAIVDAALAEKGRRHSITSGTSPHPEEQTIIRLKNVTGGNLPRGAIVDIQGGPIFTPGTSLEAFLEAVTVKGTVPTSTTKHSFGVLLEPIGAGGVGRATVGGITACRVNMVDATHVSAEALAGDTTRLQSVKWSGNPQNVLWAEAGTGTRWALVRMDAGSCGCASEPPLAGCCPPPPATPGTLYLSDGFGTVPLVYGGPTERPVANQWGGCATRTAHGGRVDNPGFGCEPTPVDIQAGILYALFCAANGTGYQLQVLHNRCVEAGGSAYHLISGYGCGNPWPSYNGTVPINGVLHDCDPFHLTFSYDWRTSQTPYLSEIYGDRMELVITS